MRTSQHHLDQKVNSEAQRSSSLVAQLQAMVAEREEKVQQLELEIGQLSMQVSRALAWQFPFPSLASPPSIQKISAPSTSFHLP
jgi:Zn finger protein HypA/HybF involved in hydrogenase expression